jgi:hypothetical protein
MDRRWKLRVLVSAQDLQDGWRIGTTVQIGAAYTHIDFGKYCSSSRTESSTVLFDWATFELLYEYMSWPVIIRRGEHVQLKALPTRRIF